EVAEGRFRDDLSYRLRVVPLYLPPLRRRDGDVEALFWQFVSELNHQGMRRIDGVTRTAMDAILAYPWPGNVRELRSAVEYAFVVGEGPTLDVEDLSPELRGEPTPGMPGGSLAEMERGRILAALARHQGRKAAAAADLGLLDPGASCRAEPADDRAGVRAAGVAEPREEPAVELARSREVLHVDDDVVDPLGVAVDGGRATTRIDHGLDVVTRRHLSEDHRDRSEINRLRTAPRSALYRSAPSPNAGRLARK